MYKQELKIEHEQEQDRYYIPVGEKYEVQTRGRGSSYRILNKDTGHRELIMDECTYDFLTTMARDLHAEHSQLNARIKELEGVIKELNYCEVYMTHEFNSLKPVIEAFSRRFGGNEVARLTEKDDEEDCFENYHKSGRKHQKMCDNILKKVNNTLSDINDITRKVLNKND